MKHMGNFIELGLADSEEMWYIPRSVWTTVTLYIPFGRRIKKIIFYCTDCLPPPACIAVREPPFAAAERDSFACSEDTE